MPKQMSRLVALKTFFGYRPGEGLKEFSAEVKQLSDREITELALLVSKELGVEVTWEGKA